jgi:4-amino-4-deoxy-L-arabinose transferase-like glycosyltransferase
VAIAVFAVLIAVAGQYGFHRDELYWIIAGRHPAFGYVDQPPFTPLVSALSVATLGVTPVALRILPAFVVAVCVWLTADMAGRMGGGSAAKLLAAVAIVASGFLLAGHPASTGTYDLLAWTVILWLAVRLLDGGDPRLWPALGVVAGLGLENKYLVVFLGVGLGSGCSRRWTSCARPHGRWGSRR